MFNLKKILSGTLLASAVSVPVFAGDFFPCPEDFMPPEFRCAVEQCRRGMPQNILVRECPKGYTIELVTPGVPKEDYDVSLTGDVLKITIGKKECPKDKDKAGKDKECPKQKKGKCPKAKACRRFGQAYKLPGNADKAKIKAVYKDGIMKICIPKVKEEAKPEQKIAIE